MKLILSLLNERQPLLGFRATSPASSSSSWLVLRRDELLWLAGGHQVVWTSYDKKVFSQHHLSTGIPTLRRSARPTGDFWVSLTKCWNFRFPGKPRENGILTNTRVWRRRKEQSRFSCMLLPDMRLVHFCGAVLVLIVCIFLFHLIPR